MVDISHIGVPLKVKDAAHAVRILKALVEKGEKLLSATTKGPWWTELRCNMNYVGTGNYHTGDRKEVILASEPEEGSNLQDGGIPEEKDADFIAASRSLVPALVEGAKAALEDWAKEENIFQKLKALKSGFDLDHWDKLEKKADLILILAQAYAPGMEEAGMEVPE